MAGVSIVAQIQDREVTDAMARLARGHGRAVMAGIKEALWKDTKSRFRSQTGPDGQAWAKLHPLYAPIKRGAGILRSSGMLFASLHAEIAGDEARVGTNAIQARIHQFGGVIVPKRARFLRFRLSIGMVRAMKVTMPARPFLGISAAGEEMIGDAVMTAYEAIFGGSGR